MLMDRNIVRQIEMDGGKRELYIDKNGDIVKFMELILIY